MYSCSNNEIKYFDHHPPFLYKELTCFTFSPNSPSSCIHPSISVKTRPIYAVPSWIKQGLGCFSPRHAPFNQPSAWFALVQKPGEKRARRQSPPAAHDLSITLEVWTVHLWRLCKRANRGVKDDRKMLNGSHFIATSLVITFVGCEPVFCLIKTKARYCWRIDLEIFIWIAEKYDKK